MCQDISLHMCQYVYVHIYIYGCSHICPLSIADIHARTWHLFLICIFTCVCIRVNMKQARMHVTLPATAEKKRVIVVGDVHGCYDELCDLLEKVICDAVLCFVFSIMCAYVCMDACICGYTYTYMCTYYI